MPKQKEIYKKSSNKLLKNVPVKIYSQTTALGPPFWYLEQQK